MSKSCLSPHAALYLCYSQQPRELSTRDFSHVGDHKAPGRIVAKGRDTDPTKGRPCALTARSKGPGGRQCRGEVELAAEPVDHVEGLGHAVHPRGIRRPVPWEEDCDGRSFYYWPLGGGRRISRQLGKLRFAWG